MSGAFPTSPLPSSVKFRSLQPTFISVSHALNTHTRTRNAQRWSLELQFAPVYTWATFAPIFAFLLKQKGRAEQFTYTLPTSILPARGNWGGSILVNGGSQTGTTIDLDGFGASDSDAVKAGDLIQWDKKIYIVTDDAASNGSGEASVNIEPAIISSPGDNDPVSIHQSSGGLSMYCSLGSDETELDFNACVKYGMTILLGENIES